MHFSRLTALIVASLSIISVRAQVVIGTPAGSPDPKAVLELRDTTRGFLLPRMNQTNMNAISSPTDGLLIYNTTNAAIYQYNATAAQWRPIVADSSEWFYDPLSAKLYLRRALNNEDSFYYNTSSRKFMFADTRMYRTSSGGVFNLDEGNSDRFIFKTTASRFPRPATNLFSANLYSVYEVDNDTAAISHPYEASYFGQGSDVTVLQTASQRIGQITASRLFTTFAGTDSLQASIGIQNQVTLRGKGYVDVSYGLYNVTSIRDSTTQIGLLFGMYNFISYVSPLGTPRITGNAYGYFQSWSSALNGKVDGNVYGIFMSNVTGAGIGVPRNWSLFTNKGAVRLGDSTLVTEGSFARARAIFDVNSPSAMILPTGSTAQRPTTVYPGMIRYNTDTGAPETNDGGGWTSLKSPVLSATYATDPLPLVNGSTLFLTTPLTGAAIGNVVNVSPSTLMPGGMVIAWAMVSAANQVSFAISNFSGATVDLAPMSFYIRVIQ